MSCLQDRIQELLFVQSELEEVARTLNQLRTGNAVNCWVPVRRQAFLPGLMIQSDSITIGLGGEDYFMDTRTEAGMQIIERRLVWVKGELERLHSIQTLGTLFSPLQSFAPVHASLAEIEQKLQPKLVQNEGKDYVALVHGQNEEGLDIVEIKERYIDPPSASSAEPAPPHSNPLITPSTATPRTLDDFDVALLQTINALGLEDEHDNKEDSAACISDDSETASEEEEEDFDDEDLSYVPINEDDDDMEEVEEEEEAEDVMQSPSVTPPVSDSEVNKKKVSFASSVPADKSGKEPSSLLHPSTLLKSATQPILRDVMENMDYDLPVVDGEGTGFLNAADLEEQVDQSLLIKTASQEFYLRQSRLKQAQLISDDIMDEVDKDIIWDEETASYMSSDGVLLEKEDFMARLRSKVARATADASSSSIPTMRISDQFPIFASDALDAAPSTLSSASSSSTLTWLCPPPCDILPSSSVASPTTAIVAASLPLPRQSPRPALRPPSLFKASRMKRTTSDNDSIVPNK